MVSPSGYYTHHNRFQVVGSRHEIRRETKNEQRYSGGEKRETKIEG